jgi:spore coat polysaccharide biosynthesis protein SpsF (cytidylyltransferase family)
VQAAIIQARYGSTRFPGKVLEDLAGKTVLAHVIERCRLTRGIDAVVCAIPDDDKSDIVATEAEQCGAVVIRGSEHDVLDRFVKAADANGAEVVMRVTSDCPLTDPEINARVIDLLRAENCDYACNNMPVTWPHGLDCEVFTREVLLRAGREADQSYDREHVTPWIRTAQGIRRANLPGPGGVEADYRWTLDYPEDLAFFRAVHARLPDAAGVAGYREVSALLKQHPDIATINAGRRDHLRTPSTASLTEDRP